MTSLIVKGLIKSMGKYRTERSQNMDFQAVNVEVFYFSNLTKNVLVCIFDF